MCNREEHGVCNGLHFITAGCGGFIHVPHILTSFEHHKAFFQQKNDHHPACGTQLRMGNEEQQDTVLIQGGVIMWSNTIHFFWADFLQGTMLLMQKVKEKKFPYEDVHYTWCLSLSVTSMTEVRIVSQSPAVKIPIKPSLNSNMQNLIFVEFQILQTAKLKEKPLNCRAPIYTLNERLNAMHAL